MRQDDVVGTMGLRAKMLAYCAFGILFWFPFYFLVRLRGFDADVALTAASIGVLPLLLLFTPLLEAAVRRLTKVKVGAFEFGFREAVEESVSGEPVERVVTVAIDEGREVICNKGPFKDFVKMVLGYLPTPEKRLVMSIDLAAGESVYLPMLYFQVRQLADLFDLRAILFIDSRKPSPDDRILGTAMPGSVLIAMDRFYKGMLHQSFQRGESEARAHWEAGRYEEYLRTAWHTFRAGIEDAPLDVPTRLSDSLFRHVFASALERKVVRLPLDPGQYGVLMGYLDRGSNHLILVRGGEIVNVRTISNVAREIARDVIGAAIAQAGTERQPN